MRYYYFIYSRTLFRRRAHTIFCTEKMCTPSFSSIPFAGGGGALFPPPTWKNIVALVKIGVIGPSRLAPCPSHLLPYEGPTKTQNAGIPFLHSSTIQNELGSQLA